jgi:RNA polymerase sigma-70 factor (ECF subfamily)
MAEIISADLYQYAKPKLELPKKTEPEIENLESYLKLEDSLPKLRSTVRQICRGISDADTDDIVQETIAHALHSNNKAEAVHTNIPSWLYTIAQNIVIDKFRTKKRRYAKGLDELPEGAEAIDQEPNPKEQLINRLVGKEMLAKLNEKQRKVVKLLYEGNTYAEIAEQLKIPIGTVMSRLYHARQKIQKSAL